jgi:hypothetical protein
MSLSMRSFRNGKIQLKAARVLVGMPGHRPSAFNIRVGQCMKQSGATPRGGGRYSESFQKQFIECARQAGARIGGR